MLEPAEAAPSRRGGRCRGGKSAFSSDLNREADSDAVPDGGEGVLEVGEGVLVSEQGCVSELLSPDPTALLADGFPPGAKSTR